MRLLLSSKCLISSLSRISYNTFLTTLVASISGAETLLWAMTVGVETPDAGVSAGVGGTDIVVGGVAMEVDVTDNDEEGDDAA